MTLKLGAVCAVADKGALLMVPAEEEHGTSMVYRFEIVGNKINFLAEHELEASKLYRHASTRLARSLPITATSPGRRASSIWKRVSRLLSSGWESRNIGASTSPRNRRGCFSLVGLDRSILSISMLVSGRSTDYARNSVISCLTLEERAAFSLATEPPPWCITGAGRRRAIRLTRYRATFQHSDAWRDWLNAVHVARDKGDTPPPVPNLIS